MKSGIIIKEVSRSFSKHIFINLLLIVQFIISFFLLVTVLTYHLEIGENRRFGLINTINDEDWYAVGTDRQDDMNSIAEASDGLKRISAFYSEFTNSGMFNCLSYKTHQGIYFDSATMEDKFGEVAKYIDFLDRGEYNEGKVESSFNEMEDGDRQFTAVIIKSAQMDIYAYQTFDLKVIEGEGFTEKNTGIDSEEDLMPIVLGYEYRDYFEVGETIRIQIPIPTNDIDSWYHNAKVVGILEKDSFVPPYGGIGDLIYLDYYVICPMGMSINYSPDSQVTIQKYAQSQYCESLFYSLISINDGVKYNDVISFANDLSEKYDVSKLTFTSTSFGMDMLAHETETTIMILTVLTFALLAFTLFFLFSSCINRIQQNTRTYAIYMMNGTNVWELAAAFLLEMIVLYIPAVILNYFALQDKMMRSQNYAPFILVVGMALAIFAASAGIIIYKLRGISTEELMRRKD